MSSRKHLKKEINDTLGALIEEVYVKELSSPKLDTKKSEKIIDEAISLFDDLIQQMHNDSGDSVMVPYWLWSFVLYASDIGIRIGANEF